MSVPREEKSEKNESRGYSLLSDNLGPAWREFESTLKQEYYPTSFNAVPTGGISQFLQFSDDEDFDSFLSKFSHLESIDKSSNPDEKSNVNNLCLNETTCAKFGNNGSTESENAANLSQSHCSKDEKCPVPLLENVNSQDLKDCHKEVQNKECRSENIRTACKSEPKAKKIYSKKPKKKADGITRTVITETLFNGSIADIVKTRTRKTQSFKTDSDSVLTTKKSNYETFGSESSNVHVVNNQTHVKSTEVKVPPAVKTDEIPSIVSNSALKIKISLISKSCEISECQTNVLNSKRKHKHVGKKSKRERNSSPDKKCSQVVRKNVENENIKFQLKKKKSDVKLNFPERDKTDSSNNCLTSPTSELDLGLQSPFSHGGSVAGKFVERSDSENTKSSVVSSIHNSNSPFISEQNLRSEDYSVPLSSIKKEILEHVDDKVPVTKKKLRGIAEYKAHKAKCKQENKLSHTPLVVPSVSASDSFKQNGVNNLLQKTCDSKLQNASIHTESSPAQIIIAEPHLLAGTEVRSNTISGSSEFCAAGVKNPVSHNGNKFKVVPGEFSLGADINNIVDSQMENTDDLPNSMLFKVSVFTDNSEKFKSEVTDNCAITLSKPSPDGGESSHTSVEPLTVEAWHDIPANTDAKCPSTQSVAATEYVNSCSITCDTTNCEIEDNPNSPILPEAYLSQPESGDSVARTETSKPSTSTRIYTNDVPACKGNLPYVPLSSSSGSSSGECHKRRNRTHSSSSASNSDSFSISSYEKQGFHGSKSAGFGRNLPYRPHKDRKLQSKSKRNMSSSRYRNHRRSSSSRHRRKRSRSRKSRSRSRSYSSNSDDFKYDTYKAIVSNHPSLSSVPTREKHPKCQPKFQNNSSEKHIHSSKHTSKLSRHYSNSKHLKDGVLPSQRKQRRRHRQYSTSSHSTDYSYSRQQGSSSASRSRSRSKSYERSCHKQYQSSKRQQLWWEEQQKQIEERRVVYVGLIPDNYTKMELKSRFACFGDILGVRIHKRTTRQNDNYGFVTFREKTDAYNAVEYGNDHPLEPKFDISFGGRKGFCKQEYSDLDREDEVKESCHVPPMSQKEMSFDKLLKAELERVQARKC